MKGKRFARNVARAYVAELLRGSDMPGWPEDRGYFASDSDEADWFMDEVRRIADRIEATVTDAGREALRSQAKE
jgi:hypothetical protein